MPRPLTFDRNKAIESAMKLFWARGYASTSLSELLLAMDIARSSFYASFGTKRELFIECLTLFADRTLAIIEGGVEDQNSATAPAAFFKASLLDVSPRKASQGCMMVNTVLELADVDAELSALATTQLNRIETTFAALFKQAQLQGHLDQCYTPNELAGLVMNINFGLRVQSRQKISRKKLQPLINHSLLALGLAA